MKVWDRTGIKLTTPGSAVRHASVARHASVSRHASVADCAMWPGTSIIDLCKYSLEANSVKPDQTAPTGAVWSEFTLFVEKAQVKRVSRQQNKRGHLL